MLRKLLGKLLGSSSKPAATSSAAPAKAGQHSGRGERGGHGGKGAGSKSGSAQGAGRTHSGERKDGHAERRPRDHDKPHGPGGSKRGHASGHGGGDARPADQGSPEGGQRRRRRRGGRGRGRDDERGRSPEQEQNRGDGSRRDHDRPRHRATPSQTREPEAPELESVAASQVAAEPPAPSAPIEVPAVSEDNDFSDLGLEPFIVAAVEAMGYLQPTPIQSEAIPVVLTKRDVIGSAQTGTGKTAAFGLPILQHLRSHGSLRCLILEPTRELALQVDEAFQSFSKYTDLRTAVIYGGVGYGAQRDALRHGLDVIVATPGRLLDHIEQRALSLKGINYLVLDEVDRMLDMGFLPDVKKIIGMCPSERQTLFFSATIPPELEKLTNWCLRDPHTIEIGRRRSAAETVSHAFYPVIEAQKFDLLLELLERTHYESVLIFCRTKHGADFVASRLERKEHKVAVMHSNRSQAERTEALKGFRSGKYEVMVATDLAARGLDIAGITHVVNFDTPLHPEDYVHRIGRTGRAQTEGDAFTLLTEEELKYAAAIERFIGQKVERKKLENFPYQYSAIFAQMEGDPKNVFRSRLYRGTKR